MLIPDPVEAERWLKSVGYYRLSAYWLHHEIPPTGGKTRSKQFKAGTSFTDVIACYEFDQVLRSTLLRCIMAFEVALRASWVRHLADQDGAHAYLKADAFNDKSHHMQSVDNLRGELPKSDEKFIKHYLSIYTDPDLPPLWAMAESLTIGQLVRWITNTSSAKVKTAISSDMGLPNQEVMKGVIQSVAYVRNICAHHFRLWNRHLVKRPPIVHRIDKDIVTYLHKGQKQSENKVYNFIVVLLYLMDRQKSLSHLRQDIVSVVRCADNQILEGMGFPDNWRSRPIWT